MHAPTIKRVFGFNYVLFIQSNLVNHRHLIAASIGGGGGIAREMFVRVSRDINGALEDISAASIDSNSYLNNDHLPVASHTRVALLLVGELRSFSSTSPWLQAHVISSIGTESVDVFAAVRPLPALAPGAACGQVRSSLSNVVSCHEIPTITGRPSCFPAFFPMQRIALQGTAMRLGRFLRI